MHLMSPRDNLELFASAPGAISIEKVLEST